MMVNEDEFFFLLFTFLLFTPLLVPESGVGEQLVFLHHKICPPRTLLLLHFHLDRVLSPLGAFHRRPYLVGGHEGRILKEGRPPEGSSEDFDQGQTAAGADLNQRGAILDLGVPLLFPDRNLRGLMRRMVGEGEGYGVMGCGVSGEIIRGWAGLYIRDREQMCKRVRKG